MFYLPFARFWVCIIFNIIILERKFFSSKDNGDFSPLFLLMIYFSWFFKITLSPMSVICHWDCSLHGTFTPYPLFFDFCGVAWCLFRGGEILIGWTNIGAEEGLAAAGLPMLGPRFPTAAAWEGGARMTLCASGGLPCGQGVGGSSLQRKWPSTGRWGGDIVTTRWRCYNITTN